MSLADEDDETIVMRFGDSNSVEDRITYPHLYAAYKTNAIRLLDLPVNIMLLYYLSHSLSLSKCAIKI